MGGRIALEDLPAGARIASRALRSSTPDICRWRAGAAGEQEARNRAELVALAESQGMVAMLRKWLPPMIDSRRINDTALVNAIIEMMSRKTPEIFAAQVRALLARPDASAVLEQIRCPALLAHRPRRRLEPARATLGDGCEESPEASLSIVPDCGHMSMMERPAEVSAAHARLALYSVIMESRRAHLDETSGPGRVAACGSSNRRRAVQAQHRLARSVQQSLSRRTR